MSMELRKGGERPTTPDPASSDSATTTAVNSPATAQFPQDSESSHTQDVASVSLADSSDDDSDAESEDLPEDSVVGWPQLAQLMAKTPDLAAFPRFRDLQVKSLLYYQCELNTLREKLHELEYTDKAEAKSYNEYADELIRDRKTSDQFKKIEEIRVVLKKYNKALLQYSQICALPDPEPFNMRNLRKWLKDKNHANWHVKDYNGAVKKTWGLLVDNADDEEKGLWSQFAGLIQGLLWMRRPARSKHDPDLALTKPRGEVDGLTHWYASEYVPFKRALKRKFKSKKKTQDVEQSAEKRTRGAITPVAPWRKEVKTEKTLESWSEDSALRLTSGISTVVACLMPVIAISVLSQLQGLRNLLICLAAFSLVFAVGLIALTQGTSKRTEVFAATAAFSAVMVVFISIPPAPVIMMPPGSALPSVSPSAVISALPSG